MKTLLLFAAALLPVATAARAQQAQSTSVDAETATQIFSSAETGGTDTGPPVNDPTSLTGRGGPTLATKTYQETIGTPIYTAIGAPIGTRIGVPH